MKRELLKIGTLIILIVIMLSGCATNKQIMDKWSIENSYFIIDNPSYSDLKMTTFSLIMAPVTSLGGVLIGYDIAKRMGVNTG
jgi:hypothetical protein